MLLALLLPAQSFPESRFTIASPDFAAVRTALLGAGEGYTEIGRGERRDYIVGAHGREGQQRLAKLLREWNVTPEKRAGREIFFLLPLFKNEGAGPRRPLFSPGKSAALEKELGERFHYTPKYVEVFGEWKDKGKVYSDASMMIRVPVRRGTRTALRRFLREKILADPECDQVCLYLSVNWRGEYVYPN